MGVERYLVAATLRLAVAQRLVRKLCQFCKCEIELNNEQKLIFKDHLAKDQKVYHSTGCYACNGKGYQGRIGLFEIMEVNAELSTIISSQGSEKDIMDFMQKKKQKTLIQDAVEKIQLGLCSVDEALKVLST